ncbi:catenin alpha-2-like [Antedon mediterranea]|uniref:catenin alpha-2-like n=1 Tax=Antedon mediterranea TaxID=105859 RepID=UPI003AF67B2D
MNISGNILSSVVQTRSIERVLAPIAAQVSQLIILNESAKDTPGSLPNLSSHAQSVRKATEELVLVGQRLAKDSKDEELRKSMPKACEMIDTAGNSMMLASQILQTQPENSGARENLVKAARDVLEGTMKVMLITDDTEVRKIVRAAHWTIDRLTLLKSVETMKTLVESFKGFTEAIMLLSSLCDKRQQDLTQQQPKQRLLVAMSTLKKATPMLSSIMQSFVKYPKSSQAKASRDYILKHIMVAVTEIINVVEKAGSMKPERNEEPGHFAIKIDKAMKELSPEHRYNLSVDFDCLLESIVRHSMAVASAVPQEHLREGIVKSCKEILRQRTIIQEECINVQDNPGFKQLKADYDQNCEAFARDFLILEKHIKSALICQVVDTFIETVEPLERLIKAATVPLKEKGQLDEKICLEILEPLETAFLGHLDRVCQTGSFMAASCIDHKRVELIQAAVNTMEQIDPEILPACIAVRQDVLDKRAIQHIKLIHREWKNEVSQLVDCIDELIDRNRFLEVTEAYVKGDITQCREASTIADLELLSEAANCMLGRAKRVIQVAMKEVDSSKDPVYRNGVLVFVNQLQKVIPVVKDAANNALEHINQESAHTKLAEKANELLECIEDVHEGLDPRSHPNILSPLRSNVRDDRHSRLEGSLVVPASRRPIQHNESYLSNPLPKCSGIVDVQPSTIDFDSSAVANSISGIMQDMSLMNRTAKTKAEASYALMPKNLRHPMVRLMKAVYKMDSVEVDACNNIVLEQTRLITDLALRLADSLNDTEIKRHMKAQAENLLDFVPQVMGTAKASLLKEDRFKAEAHLMVEDWTDKMNSLIKCISDATNVWFSVVNKSLKFAKAGDNKNLNHQLEQLDIHMQILRQTVTSTIESCRVLDQTRTSRSTYSTQIQIIQTLATQLTRLAKSLSTAANEVAIAEGDVSLESKLELLVLEWAVKHHQLFQVISSIDKKSMLMTDNLEDALQTGSQELIEKEAGNIKKACGRLVETATTAILGLKDSMKVEETTEAMSDVDKLSTELMSMLLQTLGKVDINHPIQPRVLLIQRQLKAKAS